MVSTLVNAPPTASPAAQAPSLAVAGFGISDTSRHNALERRSLMSAWKSDISWESWGLRGFLTTTKQGTFTDYNIGFSVSLPLARVLGSYVFSGYLSLRSTPLCQSAFTFRHPSYLAVARVVDQSHPFIQACIQDDLAKARSMLLSGEGRPTDVTIEGTSPMMVSTSFIARQPSSTIMRT